MGTVTLRRRGTAWQLDYYANGQRQRPSLGAIPKKQAENLRRAKEYELAGLSIGVIRAPSFLEWCVDYVLWHELEYPASHERVAQIIEDYLAPKFGHWPLDMLPVREVQVYITERRAAGAKSATIAKEIRTLKAIVHRAVKLKVIREDPLTQVSSPKILDSKPHRYYSQDELQAIYGATKVTVNGGEANPHHEAWWRLYANTGMRRAEGIHLLWKNVGRDGMQIVSTEEDRTKSGLWRDIPLSKGAESALEALRERKVDEFVLPRITLPSLSRAFVRDAVRARLDGSLHTLRHTFISHLVLRGTHLRTVQLYAGHSTIQVTEQYAYLSPGRAQASVTALCL